MRSNDLYCASLLFLTIGMTGVCAQELGTDSHRVWVGRLTSPALQGLDHRNMMQQLFDLNSDAAYAIVKEAWPRIKDLNTRMEIERYFLLGYTGFGGIGRASRAPDPHAMDILDLIILEETPPPDEGRGGLPDYVKDQAFQEARGIALQPLKDAAEYRAWRKSIEGKAESEVIAATVRGSIKILREGTPRQQVETMKILSRLRWWTGTSGGSSNGVRYYRHTADGVMGLRRFDMIEAGLVSTLGTLLKPENPAEVRRDALLCLARFAPDDDALRSYESDLKRELPVLVESAQPDQPPGGNPSDTVTPNDCAMLLMGFSSDWAVDLIAKLLVKSVSGAGPNFSITNEIQQINSPRLIPTLIGVLDAPSPFGPGFNPYDNTLRQLARADMGAGMGRSTTHDSLWWRVWWHDNKKNYPADVQKLPIPQIRSGGVAAATFTNAAAPHDRLTRVYVSEDEMRSYWLISANVAPPVRMSEQAKEAIANSGIKPLAAVKQERAGLIVVLTDEDASDPAVIDQWLDVSDGLDRRYYVAVAIRPRLPGVPAGRWPTSKERAAAPLADFTTEAFVEQIARQVQSNIAIDPDHVYLIAAGGSGTAAYSCAFQAATPFRGFCLLSAPYRSAQLPPPFAAKGRWFFIGLGLSGASSGDSLAAAEPLLLRHSAKVHVAHLKSGTLPDAIRDGVQWLER